MNLDQALCFASGHRVRILPRGSGREEPDQGIDPFAGVTWVVLELVKIFVIHPGKSEKVFCDFPPKMDRCC